MKKYHFTGKKKIYLKIQIIPTVANARMEVSGVTKIINTLAAGDAAQVCPLKEKQGTCTETVLYVAADGYNCFKY